MITTDAEAQARVAQRPVNTRTDHDTVQDWKTAIGMAAMSIAAAGHTQQAVLTADAYVSSTATSSNYGSSTALKVSGNSTALFKLDIANERRRPVRLLSRAANQQHRCCLYRRRLRLRNVIQVFGAFKIDNPVDPEGKYLVHSFVESPDMMNVYNGNVVTDVGGTAVVILPEWFESLNRDFRYQLTAIGQPAQAWVSSKVANNKFIIRTDKGGVEVSWQVTGIRQDAWANAHRLPTEVEKNDLEKGRYIHPELFGHAGEPSVNEVLHPASRIRPEPQQ